METSHGGPLIVKPTRGELRACVELLAKKRRSVKGKAQDPPESSLPTRGKVPKMGVFVPRSPVKERGSHAQVGVRRQALSSSIEVSEVAGVQRRSSSAVGAKSSSRRAVKPPLKVLPIFIWSPSAQNASPSPPIRGDVGNDRFEVGRGGGGGGGGVRTRYLPMWSLLPGLFCLSFGTLISRRWKPCALRRLWLCPSRGPSLYVRVPSFIRLVVVLMLSSNSILFLGRRLLI